MLPFSPPDMILKLLRKAESKNRPQTMVHVHPKQVPKCVLRLNNSDTGSAKAS